MACLRAIIEEMWIFVKIVLFVTILKCNGLGVQNVFAPFVEKIIKNQGDIKVES